jgi:CheY-like chemotaxis protein
LSKLDYEVHYALNGYDALKMMEAEPFDVIVITDLKMSSLGGMEVLRRVKDAYPDTPRDRDDRVCQRCLGCRSHENGRLGLPSQTVHPG